MLSAASPKEGLPIPIRKQWLQSKGLLCAVCAAVFVLIFFVSHQWQNTFVSIASDDYAAYLNEDIALAEGNLEMGFRRNAFMHHVRENSEGKLIYSMGYPLLLAAVYRLVGWDALQPNLLLYYKLIGPVCLALTGAVLLLLFRRRFSLLASAALVLMCCCNIAVLGESNRIQNDIPCLLFSCLCLLLAECYAQQPPLKIARRLAWALALALSGVCCAQMRLNGSTVMPVCFLYLCLNLQDGAEKHPLYRRIAWALLPMALFGVLYLLSGLVLPLATSNSGDIGQISLQGIVKNIRYYYLLCRKNLLQTLPFPLPRALPLLVLTGIGCVAGLFSRKNAHLSVFIVLSLAVLCLLDYVQGFRYVMNIFPLLVLCMAYALQLLWRLLLRLIRNAQVQTVLRAAAAVLLALYVGVFCRAALLEAQVQVRRSPAKHNAASNLYNDCALELYAYIRDCVPMDDVVVSDKPRALYLNTGRLGKCAIPPREGLRCGVGTEEARWLLVCTDQAFVITPFSEHEAAAAAQGLMLQQRFQNDVYALYALLPNGEAGTAGD